MDYSQLVAAIKKNDTETVNALIKKIRPRLLAFLCIHMDANHMDAQDIAQEALLTTIEVIQEGRTINPEQIVSYMLSICRNEYIKEQKKKQAESIEEITPPQRQAPRQLQSLLDEEQQRLLQWCLQQLKGEYQKYMQYWFNNPDAHTQKVAARFDISVNNAWTRKHRLIKKLNECYQKKSNL